MSEGDFSTLNGASRVALCLEHAQAALDRANACGEFNTKQTHLTLAECWYSIARQFETLSELSEAAPRQPMAVVRVQAPADTQFDLRAGLPLSMQLSGFAAA